MSNNPQQGLFRWLWHAYMARHIGVILLAMLFMTIEGSMLGAMSYIMKPMFDQVLLFLHRSQEQLYTQIHILFSSSLFRYN